MPVEVTKSGPPQDKVIEFGKAETPAASDTKPASNDVRVRAIRTFAGQEGYKSPNSEPFTVSRGRAAELKANGLVEEVQDEAKPADAKPDAAKK